MWKDADKDTKGPSFLIDKDAPDVKNKCQFHREMFTITDTLVINPLWDTYGHMVRQLTLEKCGLKSLPESMLGFLDKLENLSLSQNSLETLPADIGNCSNLIRLDVSHNLLKAGLDTLNKCSTSLKFLNISHNLLKKIPEQVFECSNLAELTANHIALIEISPSIGKLVELRTLSLEGNRQY